MGRHRIRLAGREYLLCPSRLAAPRNGRRLSSSEFRRLLLAHASNLRLRGLLTEYGNRRMERRRHHGPFSRDRQVLGLAELLCCYELPTVPPRLSPVALSDYVPVVPQPAEPGPMFDEQTHWIEFCIVGEDDEPLSGITCEITLPSGKVVRRRTDGHGLVRIEGIAIPGACSLALPDHDRDAWEPA